MRNIGAGASMGGDCTATQEQASGKNGAEMGDTVKCPRTEQCRFGAVTVRDAPAMRLGRANGIRRC